MAFDREGEFEAVIYCDPEQFLQEADITQALDAVEKAAVKAQEEASKKHKAGIDSMSADLTLKFEDGDQNEYTIEDVKAMTEEQREDLEISAVIGVEASVTDSGEYQEGYVSHDWYTPSESSYIDGQDADESVGEALDYIETALKEYGFEVNDSEVTDTSFRDWDDICEEYEQDISEPDPDDAYDDWRDRQSMGEDW
jgi:hypothetical protein